MIHSQFWSAFADDWDDYTHSGAADTGVALYPVFEPAPVKQVEKQLEKQVKQVAKSNAVNDWFADFAILQKVNKLLDEFAQQLFSPPPSAQDEKPADNTQHKEKYEYITEYGTQVLCLLSATSGCLYLSRNFEKITGHHIAEKQGEAFFSIIHPDFRDKLRLHLPTGGKAEKPQELKIKLQHVDGQYYWYQITIHSKETENVCILENINEFMKVQATLQKSKLEAELALRARSEFLANMSHELRTPLNAVIGFSQIMESGVLGKIENPHHAEYVKNIKESGHDLLAKIEDLLEIADIEAGRIALAREEIYINDLIQQMLQMQTHHANAKRVTISYVPRGNMLMFVDRLKLQHVLGHLVANAIKFNRAGGEVVVEVSRAADSGMMISIHDTGDGISNIKCHDIREALARDNCWTGREGQHLGVGLALTKEIIDLHDGRVEINSRVGIGTTVSITLPRSCLRIFNTSKPRLVVSNHKKIPEHG